jgi:hypothetical protein
VALSWFEWPDGRPTGLIRGTQRKPGGRFSSPVTLAQAGDQVPLATALADDGRLLLVWPMPGDGGERLVYARVRAADGSLGEPELLQTVAAPRGNADVSVLQAAWTRAGERIAAWSAAPHRCFYCTREIVYAAWASPNGRFGAPKQLSASDESNDEPHLAVARSGRALLAWARADGTETPPGPEYGRSAQAGEVPSDIRFATRSRGHAFGRTRSIGESAAQPRVAMVCGDAFLAWTGGPDDEARQTIMSAFRPADLTARLVQPIPGTARSVYDLDVASRPGGQVVAAWNDGSRRDQHPPWRIMVAVRRSSR